MTPISFIITAREESPDVLRRTIEELRATTPPAEREILVIDDGSTLPVSGVGLDVWVVRNDEPAGGFRARGRGVPGASGHVLVILDAHMTFDHNWLTRMLAHVESGALLCSAFWDYERSVCHCFGADFQWNADRNYSAQRYPGFGLRHRTRFPGEGARDVPMAIGACYMLLRSTYESLGGFSPLFRVWGADEQDLSARAWLAGFGVKCVTEARVGHLWRPAFRYPVYFEHLEFNQLALIRSVFDAQTTALLQACFEPVPERVREWWTESDVRSWRGVVQQARRCDDRDFFLRFVPDLHRQRVRLPS